jgi:hypothetical protein
LDRSPLIDRKEELVALLIPFIVITACVIINLMVAVQCDVFRTLQKVIDFFLFFHDAAMNKKEKKNSTPQECATKQKHE